MKRAPSVLGLVLVIAVACGGRTSLGTGSSPDASAPVDAGTATLGIVDVFVDQNCMPFVSPDPVFVDGQLVITNTTSAAIGPITVLSGEILDETNTVVLATFAVDADPIGVIPVGGTVTSFFVKVDDSMKPAKGCAIACDRMLRVALVLSGPGLPSGARASSKDTPMGCVF